MQCLFFFFLNEEWMTPHMGENTVTLFFHFVLGRTHLARSL